jgi:hypothetical protein
MGSWHGDRQNPEQSAMQHPLEGVRGAGPEEARPTRRSVLGRMPGAMAALIGTSAAASAQRGIGVHRIIGA